jgi:hypothetical protein
MTRTQPTAARSQPPHASPFLSVPPSKWLASSPLAFAIRDRHPVSPGHTLVISRREVATYFDATAEEKAAQPRFSRALHHEKLASPPRIPRGSGGLARQQPDRARDPRSGHRAPQSFWLEVSPRNADGRHSVHPGGNSESLGRRSIAYLAGDAGVGVRRRRMSGTPLRSMRMRSRPRPMARPLC